MWCTSTGPIAALKVGWLMGEQIGRLISPVIEWIFPGGLKLYQAMPQTCPDHEKLLIVHVFRDNCNTSHCCEVKRKSQYHKIYVNCVYIYIYI